MLWCGSGDKLLQTHHQMIKYMEADYVHEYTPALATPNSICTKQAKEARDVDQRPSAIHSATTASEFNKK